MPNPEQILDALDTDQRAAATALRGPVRILAGAGTGKTRAITHRIAYGVHSGTYQANQVLAVTFTARAAGEMRIRLRDLGVTGVQARTFHAAALRQLSYFWPRVIGGDAPRVLEQKAKLVAEAANTIGLSVDRLVVRDLASEIEWSKVSLLTAEEYATRLTPAGRQAPGGYTPTDVARLITAYEDAKTARGVIDFEDVLLLLSELLRSHREVAEVIRRQYRHFVVDEYQDVSPLQQFLLEQWLGNNKDLCVVGDPAQTIYSFTGASPYYLLNFTKTYPKATTVELVRDYRSTPQIVAAANTVLTSAKGTGQFQSLKLVAQREPGPKVAYESYDDDHAEARATGLQIRKLMNSGLKGEDIAVLFRTNSQSRAVEEALTELGIGYAVRGGEQFFQRREVKDAIALIRAAASATGGFPQPMPQAVREALTSIGWEPAAPATAGAMRERWEALQALVDLADTLHSEREANLQDFTADLEERVATQHAPTNSGITLASIHAAKGLEWRAVFLIGLSDGLLPISLAKTPGALAEEQRLLYVGITRAQEFLTLSYARSRSGARSSRKRSRFLDPLWPKTGKKVFQ